MNKNTVNNVLRNIKCMFPKNICWKIWGNVNEEKRSPQFNSCYQSSCYYHGNRPAHIKDPVLDSEAEPDIHVEPRRRWSRLHLGSGSAAREQISDEDSTEQPLIILMLIGILWRMMEFVWDEQLQ